MGGGPTQQQQQAATSQANLTNQESQIAGQNQAFVQSQQNKANPFYTERMQNGLPYMNAMTDAQSGVNAQAFAPARANLMRSFASQPGLPSGSRQGALSDLDAAQARSYDSTLLGGLAANEQAKQAGASGILGQAQIANPLGYFQGAEGGNQSIMQAPLQKPGIGGILGGIAGGAASAIPF